MYNLFEIVQAAQDGQAMTNLARQFGLSQAQAQSAIEAMLPAFSLGLQRKASNPFDFTNLMGMLGTGQYAPAFDNPAMAFGANAMARGDEVLKQLFGTNDVSRQVAGQAAAMAGIVPDTARQMMPIVAAMIMGGLFKAATSQGLGPILGQLGTLFQKGDRAAAPPQSGFPNVFPPGMTGFGLPQAPAPAPQEPVSPALPFDPTGGVFSAMLEAMFPRPEPEPEPEPENPAAAATGLALARITSMFESGLDAGKQNAGQMQAIFETMLGVNRPDRK